MGRADLDGKAKPRCLTGDRANDRHLRWAADGQFRSTWWETASAAEAKPPYDGTAQVWQVSSPEGSRRR
ncbi:MAG: hypothetical protein U0797_25200 [Gemmataceae bacterium]